MDIFDNSERQVLCISNADNDVFDCDENSPLQRVIRRDRLTSRK